MKFKNSQKGVSLYLALIILSLNLSIVLGLSIILIDEIKITKSLGYSVIAFYAADTGIEKMIGDRDNPNTTPGYYDGYFDLDNSGGPKDSGDSEYNVTVTPRDDLICFADNYCVESIGTYKETQRAIKITY